MRFDKDDLGKIYKVSSILAGIPCEKCNSCIRMRLMEMGLVAGEKIEVSDYKFGLWTINVLSKFGNIVSTLALRDEEIDRICVL